MRLNIRIATLAAMIIAVMTSHQLHSEEHSTVAQGDGTSQEVSCPCCHHVCKLSTESVQQKKSCWKIAREPICIPRVRFPWQTCDTPLCAKIRYVNVLKKHEYECERCHYKWSPLCASCGGDGTHGCTPHGGCAAARGCDLAPQQPTQPLMPVAPQDDAQLRPITPSRTLSDRAGPSTPPPIARRPTVHRGLSDR